jgi:hypothetical protein
MRFLHDEPNTLNVLGIREIDFCPKSWTKIRFNSSNWNVQRDIELYRQWIYNNLSGRFCIVTDVELVDNKMETVYNIGFEEGSELTMFSLGCSHLHEQGSPSY